MSIPKIVNILKTHASEVGLRFRHAAAIINNGRILSIGINNDRTYNSFLHSFKNTSICCSTHAEMAAIHKFKRKDRRIL
jgi:deoxycytidylate deaminase